MGFLSRVSQRMGQVLVPPESPAKPATVEGPKQVKQLAEPRRYGKTCGRCGTYFVAEKMNETLCHWCGRTWSPGVQSSSA